MKVLIQCAGSKDDTATSLSWNEECVEFVARPNLKPGSASPWTGIPGLNDLDWIDCLKSLNQIPGSASWDQFEQHGIRSDGLFLAGDLYARDAYSELTNHYGHESVYILSAGWGLLRADRLTPRYDITFSQSAKGKNKYKHVTTARRSGFGSVETKIDGDDEVHVFATPAYLDYLKRSFSLELSSRLILHWRRGQITPPGFHRVIERDCGEQRTNWHYTAVDQFLRDQR